MANAAEISSPDWQRRSLAVLVADAVEYSRLMEADEPGVYGRMRALRAEAIDPCIVSHRGEIVKNTGDGFLACFESPRDALRCATELQNAITRRESKQAPDRRIAFRLGLNVEQIIVDHDDIFGRGVNVASRLQEFAPPGGIVVSQALKESVDAELGLALDDLGDLHLKNITKPVRAYVHSPAGVPPSRSRWSGREARRAHLPTLAILPLKNISPDPANTYFAEGVIEDLIVNLAALRDLLVISRGSVLGLGPDATTETVSQRLGVRYVLGGSVRRDGPRLRFTFELRDAASGSVVWADRQSCGLPDLFDLQEAVVDRVVASVVSNVRRAEIRRATRKQPDSLDAYDYLLQALNLLYRLDFPSFSRARVCLERAMEADDDYAAPYAYAAKWHVFNVGQGWSTDAQADGAEALRLANLAIERDPFDSLAHAVQGHVHGMLLKDYGSATEAFDRALETCPGNSWAWILSSGTYGYVGQAASGVERAERGIRLSPVDQHAFYYYCLLAQNHYLNDAFEEAISWSRKSLRANMNFGNAIRIAAASFVAVGRVEEARQLGAHLMAVQPRFTVASYGKRCPFQPEDVVSSYLSRLRSAGLPE